MKSEAAKILIHSVHRIHIYLMFYLFICPFSGQKKGKHGYNIKEVPI